MNESHSLAGQLLLSAAELGILLAPVWAISFGWAIAARLLRIANLSLKLSLAIGTCAVLLGVMILQTLPVSPMAVSIFAVLAILGTVWASARLLTYRDGTTIRWSGALLLAALGVAMSITTFVAAYGLILLLAEPVLSILLSPWLEYSH